MIKRFLKLSALFLACISAGALSAFFALTFLVKHTETAIVPDLREKDIVHALDLLTRMGLNTKMKGFAFHGELPRNVIIDQEPEPGMVIKKGRDVWLTLSKGFESFDMPDLTGVFLEESGILLEKFGLCENRISRIFDETFEKGQIVAHIPKAGFKIIRGQCVDLLVSEGARPKAYKMPNLVGMPVDQAILSIENHHLVTGEILYTYTDRNQYRKVLMQDPEQGTPVLENSTVHLTVNARDKDSFHLSASVFFYHRLSNGFLKKHVRIELTGKNISRNIIDDFFRPGTVIYFWIPKSPGMKISLYEDWKLVKRESI